MLKWIGIIFLVMAGAVLASDFVQWGGEGAFRLTALGEWWFWAHKDSLQVLQPAIERHVSISLYVDVVQPLLLTSLAIELAVVGVFFWIVSRLF